MTVMIPPTEVFDVFSLLGVLVSDRAKPQFGKAAEVNIGLKGTST
jgi:hypothetical protein